MNKHDYEKLGAEHARNGDIRLYAETATSWQAVAYWKGIRSVGDKVVQVARDPGKVRTLGTEEDVEAMVEGWPRGAQEHARQLARQHATEPDPQRRQRLRNAIQRLRLRHTQVQRRLVRIWVDELVAK